jgi:hypothetical protein
MIHPQFRTKVAQRRGAMTTRRLVPILNEFAERARSRPKGAGTKVGTACCALFAAINLERTAAAEKNRALVVSLKGIGALYDPNACSDKGALFDAFESEGVIGAVRMCGVCFAATQHTACLTPSRDRGSHVRRRCDLRRALARLPALTALRSGDAA